MLVERAPAHPPGFSRNRLGELQMCNQPAFHRPQMRPDSPVKPPELDFYMPATPPLAFLEKIGFWLKIFRRRHHFRRLFVPLLEEEDLMLSDTGFNRTDIEWALELPLKIDALKALGACRKAREENEGLRERVIKPVAASVDFGKPRPTTRA